MSKETIKNIFAATLSITSLVVMVAMTFSSEQFLFTWVIWVGLFTCGVSMLD